MTQKIVVLSNDEIEDIINKAVSTAIKRRPVQEQSIKEVLTNREAMKLLSVSRATLQRWREEGILPFSKVSGSIFYTRKDIESLFDSKNKEG